MAGIRRRIGKGNGRKSLYVLVNKSDEDRFVKRRRDPCGCCTDRDADGGIAGYVSQKIFLL